MSFMIDARYRVIAMAVGYGLEKRGTENNGKRLGIRELNVIGGTAPPRLPLEGKLLIGY